MYMQKSSYIIEYVPAEKAWIPVSAPDYLMINCFWVSGQYKGKGHAKELVQSAISDARSQGKNGLVTVVGTKKFHFMSDTKWLLKQGFEEVERLPNGFSLLVLKINTIVHNPCFKECVKSGECPEKEGLVVYYTNRCPFTDHYVHNSLVNIAKERGLLLKLIKLETLEEAQASPTPATIFSLFYNGKFITTDLSVCIAGRFDKIISGK